MGHGGMTVLVTLIVTVIAAGVGAATGGVSGFFIGGLIGFVLSRELAVRARLKSLEDAQAHTREAQAWLAEARAWVKEVHAWLRQVAVSGSTSPGSQTMAPPEAAAESQDVARPQDAPETEVLPPLTAPEAHTAPEAQRTPTPQDVPDPQVLPPPQDVPDPQVLPPPQDVPDPQVLPPPQDVPDPQVLPPPRGAPATRAAAAPVAYESGSAARSDAPVAGAPDTRRVAVPDGGAAGRDMPAKPSTDPLTWLFNAVKNWVTTGNAPVKVGVLVSLVGVGLLLREAHRRGIIDLTIEVRLVAAAAFGLGLLAVGWRLRRRRPVYGLSLQGGGIAVLYVTLFAAYALYDVLSAVPTASAVVVVTVGAGLLSVMQDSRSLAVLGIIGGFLAPVLTYSRPEDHVYVFIFFAVLNAAIFGVAWFKTWPELNLLGFVFTFGLTFFWLSNRYEQDIWVATQPFITLFVMMYMAMPAAFAAREAPELKRLWAGSQLAGAEFFGRAWTTPLVFGTPFIGLGLQQLALGHTEYGLAVSAAALAVAQGLLSMAAHRMGPDRRELTEAYGSLGVVFAAIAAPLALDAYFTSTVWTLQGLVLVWIGCRRERRLALIAGGVLQLLAAASFADHLGESLPYPADVLPIANEYFLGAFLLAAAGLVSGWLLQRRQHPTADPSIDGIALAWGVSWWLGAGLMEIGYQLSSGRLSASLAFTVVSVGGAALASRRLRWPHLGALGLLILPALAAVLWVSLARQSHPLDLWGWAAWPVAFAVHYLFVRWREGSFPQLTTALHAGGYWLLAVLVGVEVYWQIDGVAAGVWPLVATLAALLLLADATMLARRRLAWPVTAHWRTYLTTCAGPVLVVISVAVCLAVVASDGDPSPLPYLPVLNPLLVLAGVVLVSALAWLRLEAVDGGLDAPASVGTRASTLTVLGTVASVAVRASTLAALGTVAVTTETARTVHHWFDVPWDLVSLWDSTMLQASLSVIWAVIALSGMVAGVRLARRTVWVAGASWMAVVVAKLFLVDLSSLSAVGRVVSFIVVGVLLLIVGYLAPVPPAAPDESEEDPDLVGAESSLKENSTEGAIDGSE